MGWISDRHMKQGGSIGGHSKGRVYPKDGAPLRKITSFIRPQENIFTPALVVLECGHEANAWSMTRARCPSCKKTP